MTVEAGIVGILLLIQTLRMQLWVGRNNRGNTGKPSPWLVACEAASWSILTAGMFTHIFWEKSFWLLWIMLDLQYPALQERPSEWREVRAPRPNPARVRPRNPAFW